MSYLRTVKMIKNKIEKAVRKTELTPLMIAKKTGISKRTVNRILKMRDIGNLSLGTLIKLSFALNCKPENLFER